MTTPASTLYHQATAAEPTARLAPVTEPAPDGPWAAFLTAFDALLDAFRSDDAARLEHARQDVAALRAQLVAGGVAVPDGPRRARPQRTTSRLPGPLDR